MGLRNIPYAWRKRLRGPEPVRFALSGSHRGADVISGRRQLELVLPRGERLRIGSGVDRATLRTVLDVLRA
jgi:hypothetical protein